MNLTYDMTTGKPVKNMIRFAIPVLFGGAIEMMHSMADSIVLGRFIGVGAFAAAGASAFVYWAAFCILSGMTSGFSSVYARRFGAKDNRGLDIAVAMSLWLIVALGGLLSIAGVVGADPLLKLLNTPVEIMSDAKIYLQIRFASMLIVFLGGSANALLYAIGNSRTPFIANLIAMAVNIFLNIFFVSVTPFGIAGVAVATVIAQLCSCNFSLIKLRKARVIHIQLDDLKPNLDALREIVAIGIPLGLRDLLSAIVGLVVQRKINNYGTAYVAGVAAAKQLHCVLFAVGDALSAAAGSFVGQNFGAKKYDRVSQGVRSVKRILLVAVLILCAVMALAGRFVISFFIAENGELAVNVLDVGVRQLNIVLLLLPSYHMTLLFRACLGGMGKGVSSMMSGLIEAFVRMVAIITLPPLMGEYGLYIVEAIGWPFMMAQLMIVYYSYMRRMSGSRANKELI